MTDQAGHNIAGAVVRVYEGSIIGNHLLKHVAVTTDVSGQAVVARQRKWHLLLILIPDAEAPSVYGWCVEAPGYLRLGRTLDDEQEQRIDISLLPRGTPSTCPDTLDRARLERGIVSEPAER